MKNPRGNIRPINAALIRERLEYKDGSLFWWEVRINLEGKQIYIGSFKKDIEAAKVAAKEARGKYHGEHASYR